MTDSVFNPTGGGGGIDKTRFPTKGVAPLSHKEGEKLEGKSFREIFQAHIDEVNRLQMAADNKMTDFVTGKTDNISDVLDAVKKAELAFKTLMQIRNKLVDAYEELNRMRF